MIQHKTDKLTVNIYPTRTEMGVEAAHAVAACIRTLLAAQETVNIIFAAAPSQNEFLAALAAATGVEWERVNGFHMDEYLGLPANHPQRFGNFLRNRIFARVPFRQVFLLDEAGQGGEAEPDRYAALLAQYPADITCMGIGENTHLAFNDPHVADFRDPKAVKIVDLDAACKQQQVTDGCFPSVMEVPSFAYSLTIPALLRARFIFCMVPGINKAPAVKHTLTEPVNETYPATILREHDHAVLFLDESSARYWQTA